MRSLRRAAGLLGLLVLGAWSAPRTGAAGEPGPAPGTGPDATPGAAATGVAEDEPPFDWKKEGRRDPFTFWLDIPDGSSGKVPKEDVKDWENKAIKSAEENCTAAEEAVKNLRNDQAVTFCDRALEDLAKVDLSGKTDLQLLQERLYRLRRAADRLQKRAEAERAFKGLNLRVSGIIAKEYRSLAIVNGQVVGRGNLIQVPESTEGAVYVDGIQPNRIIVRFRGYRIELPVQ